MHKKLLIITFAIFSLNLKSMSNDHIMATGPVTIRKIINMRKTPISILFHQKNGIGSFSTTISPNKEANINRAPIAIQTGVLIFIYVNIFHHLHNKMKLIAQFVSISNSKNTSLFLSDPVNKKKISIKTGFDTKKNIIADICIEHNISESTIHLDN